MSLLREQTPYEPQSTRIAGVGGFAAATFAVCVVAIAGLDRAGAPERLVRALGPVVALAALSVFGIGARNATHPQFVAAGRRAAPFAAALAVCAAGAGAYLCLQSASGSPLSPIAAGAIGGFGVGAAVLGPLIRHIGGASLSDVVATAFAGPAARAVFGVVIAAASALVACAGYQEGVSVVLSLATGSRPLAEAVVAAALLASVAPGGLASLIASAAAGGGGLVLLALAGKALPAWTGAPGLGAGAIAAHGLEPSLPLPLLGGFAAAAIGAAALIGAAPATAACRDARTAFMAGVGGFVLSLGLAATGFLEAARPPFRGDLAAASPVAASLAGAAALAASLALAGLGVQGAARAFGVRLDQAPRRFSGLSSVRLARMRLAQAAVVAGCVLIDQAKAIDPSIALVVAMALALVVAAPMGALAASRGAGRIVAWAATLVALCIAIAGVAGGPLHITALDILRGAMTLAAAAFVVGSIVFNLAPRLRRVTFPRSFDRFAEPSG